jgi:chromosome segregation ATPase
MSAIVQEIRPTSDVEKKICDIDRRLDDLRTRRQKAEMELDRVSREENRAIRNFAESVGREKNEHRRQLEVLAGQRIDFEREMAGLASAIAEAEQERAGLLPEFEALWKLRAAHERQKKLDALRGEHHKNLEAVRAADKALLAAREAAEKSFFAWTTFKDQEAVTERLAAQEALKLEWQKNAGPNAPGNRR